jgi:hypothetical protein
MLKGGEMAAALLQKRVVLRLSSSKVGVYNVYIHIWGG